MTRAMVVLVTCMIGACATSTTSGDELAAPPVILSQTVQSIGCEHNVYIAIALPPDASTRSLEVVPSIAGTPEPLPYVVDGNVTYWLSLAVIDGATDIQTADPVTGRDFRVDIEPIACEPRTVTFAYDEATGAAQIALTR